MPCLVKRRTGAGSQQHGDGNPLSSASTLGLPGARLLSNLRVLCAERRDYYAQIRAYIDMKQPVYAYDMHKGQGPAYGMYSW